MQQNSCNSRDEVSLSLISTGEVYKERPLLIPALEDKLINFTQKLFQETEDSLAGKVACPEVQCRQLFIDKRALLLHVLLHKGFKHICLICHIPFKTENLWVKHTEDKNLQCYNLEICISNITKISSHIKNFDKVDKYIVCEYETGLEEPAMPRESAASG